MTARPIRIQATPNGALNANRPMSCPSEPVKPSMTPNSSTDAPIMIADNHTGMVRPARAPNNATDPISPKAMADAAPKAARTYETAAIEAAGPPARRIDDWQATARSTWAAARDRKATKESRIITHALSGSPAPHPLKSRRIRPVQARTATPPTIADPPARHAAPVVETRASGRPGISEWSLASNAPRTMSRRSRRDGGRARRTPRNSASYRSRQARG